MAGRFVKGDVVRFDFMIAHPVAGRRGERRSGIGTIATSEINYSCWPPGHTVRVSSSDDYKPGTLIAVASHSLGKIARP